MADTGDPQDVFDWPWFGLTEDVRPTARLRLSAGRPIALATLVDSRGSSPRPVGSRMLIDSNGVPEGYVSGGCVEASVASFALDVLTDGKQRLITLGTGSPYVDIRLPCGGSIDLWIERILPEDPIVTPWLSAMAKREAGLWLADLKTDPVPAARVGDAFFRRDEPATRLIIVGGDPVALALLRLAETMGIEAHLVRDAGPSEGPAGVSYTAEDPAAALPKIGVDPFTAVITTTHDLERDASAIVAGLKAEALYVGALGSKKRIPERTEALRAAGLADDVIARVHSPIGVDIGATSPFEIALATIADIVAVRRGAKE